MPITFREISPTRSRNQNHEHKQECFHKCQPTKQATQCMLLYVHVHVGTTNDVKLQLHSYM